MQGLGWVALEELKWGDESYVITLILVVTCENIWFF